MNSPQVWWPDIETATDQNWLESTLEFIEKNYPLEWDRALLRKLRDLQAQGRIVIVDSSSDRKAWCNLLTNKISLNATVLGFLKRDFAKQVDVLKKTEAEAERTEHIASQYSRALMELSGVLLHESSHVTLKLWNRKKDERAAFCAEIDWYNHLARIAPEFRDFLRNHVGTALDDAANAVEYKNLRL